MKARVNTKLLTLFGHENDLITTIKYSLNIFLGLHMVKFFKIYLYNQI